jgi:hypothetical protein
MSLLVTFADCQHGQLLVEIGEHLPPAATLTPWATYPVDDDPANAITPGDLMTCITCMETRTVRSAV